MAFETKYICGDCDHIFYRLSDKDPRKVGGRAPACPECKKKKKIVPKSHSRINGNAPAADCALPKTHEERSDVIADMVASGKPPSMGKSNFTKCMDETARIVMDDYKMTNLNDNLREGDNMVPKLRQDLEEKVGAGWNKDQKNNVAGLAGANLNKALTSAINTNRFSSQNNVVSQAMSVVERPVTNIIGEYRPEK